MGRRSVVRSAVAMVTIGVVLAACGGTSAPTVKSPHALGTLLRSRGLGCADLKVYPPSTESRAATGTCTLTQGGTNPFAGKAVKDPEAALRAARAGTLSALLGMFVYPRAEVLQKQLRNVASFSCGLLPDNERHLAYEVRGPNWLGITSDGRAAALVESRLHVHASRLSCPGK